MGNRLTALAAAARTVRRFGGEECLDMIAFACLAWIGARSVSQLTKVEMIAVAISANYACDYPAYTLVSADV